jgi:HNH endonuclease/NUMOD3 motif
MNALSREWLYQNSVVERLSVPKIAALAGCGTWKVFDRMKKYGVPRNKVGFNLSRAGTDNIMKQPDVVNPFKGKKHKPETKRKLSEAASVPKPHIRGSKNGMFGRTGPSNPNYIDGSSKDRFSSENNRKMRDVIKTVLTRDGGKCVKCGKGKSDSVKVHTHHLKPWAGNPALRFDPNNVVTLCKPCHNKTHTGPRKKVYIP